MPIENVKGSLTNRALAGSFQSEEDFDETEVHICDGTDMGCQENETKGFVDKNLFHVEKVPGKTNHPH